MKPSEYTTRVLIADDNVQFLASAGEMLRQRGFDCTCVSDGAEARRMIAAGVDVAVIDMNLGSVSGLQLLEEFAAAGATPDTRYVLISGWFGDGDVERCRARGADATLAKPFSIDSLIELMGPRGSA